ncbi:MAG: cytochrome o ubiquinol oxidase subunit IV [Acidiferrobacter sp.]
MSLETRDPLQHPQVQLARGGQYLGAYIASLLLTASPLWLVVHHEGTSWRLMMIVVACAAALTLVQGYFWLRLDFSRTQAWMTAALVLFIPLVVMTVGLTAWMFATLYTRTMIPTLMHAPAFGH